MNGAVARAEAGFTLVEVLISLALVALITMAGVTMLDGVLRVQARTDGRVERLGDMQRAMFLLTQDLEQVSSGDVVADGGGLTFRSRRADGGAMTVRYDLEGDVLRRTIDGRPQPLLTGVSGLDWAFADGTGAWIDAWPPFQEAAPERPAAVALTIGLRAGDGPSGDLRRLILLPADP